MRISDWSSDVCSSDLPILMTSLAFVFGVLPLAVSNGAGAGGQNAIGRAVVGGMLSATVFVIFFVPMFFVVVCRLFKHGQDDRATPQDDTSSGDKGHTTDDGTTLPGSNSEERRAGKGGGS